MKRFPGSPIWWRASLAVHLRLSGYVSVCLPAKAVKNRCIIEHTQGPSGADDTEACFARVRTPGQDQRVFCFIFKFCSFPFPLRTD